MRVLHSAFSMHLPRGQVNQMTWEQQAAQKLGIPWRSRMFIASGEDQTNDILISPTPDRIGHSVPKKSFSFLRFRQKYYQWLSKEMENFDVLLLRYNSANPLQMRFIRRCKKPVYLIHHTFEVDEVALIPGIKGVLKVRAEKYFGRKSLLAANGIVGVTNEILKYEQDRIGKNLKKGFVYPNGILYPPSSVDLLNDTRQSIPELVFVAGDSSVWHGLDLLIENISHSSSKFILHLVGNLDPSLQTKIGLDDRIVSHGMLGREALKKIYSQSWLGLSSFALFRKGMTDACTLKVREYLMHGLPVFAGHNDVFPNDFAYYHRGDPDFEKILAFASEHRQVDRNKIAESARTYIAKDQLLLSLYEWLSS